MHVDPYTMSKQWKSKSLEKYKADNNIVSRNKPSNINIDFIDVQIQIYNNHYNENQLFDLTLV